VARTHRYRACPLCEAICGLDFHFENDQLVAIHGDADDPFSRGHICPKGNAILDLKTDPDRLRTPLRRTSTGFEAISWEDAFALAGEKFAQIQRAHGANAIGAYLGNPNVHHFGHFAYLPSLLRAIKTRNIFSASSVDQWPHQVVAWAMFGHQFLLPIVDLDRTDFVLMLGANPVASNGSLLTAPGIAKRLKALTQRGKLVVVDPRRTETAAMANQYLPIRPAGDAWLLIALLQEMMQLTAPRLDGYAGKIEGFESAIAAIRQVPIACIEQKTGIDAACVRTLAAELLAAPTAAVYGRMGVSTQRFGSLCQWLIQLINLYTGNLDHVGGVLPNDPVLPVTGPGTSAGHRALWHSRVRGLPEFAGELPVAAMAEEILTPGDGQIRALLTCAGNPVLSTPDGRTLDRALESLDFMVSIDIYVNETTRHADLILPPAFFLSQHHYDVIFSGFAVRQVARWNQPLYEREENERADWEIFNGLGAAYAAASGKVWKPLPAPESLIHAALERAPQVDASDIRRAEHGLDLGALEPSLLRRLQTASGKIECAPDFLVNELRHLQALMVVTHPNQMLLIGRRDVRSNNSWMHNAERLVKGKLRHHLLVHPDDLLARGIEDGSRVCVRSTVGKIEVDVCADAAMLRGVACLPHGFGHDRAGVGWQRAARVAGASYNDISDPHAIDIPSGNAALNGTPVWVEAVVADQPTDR